MQIRFSSILVFLFVAGGIQAQVLSYPRNYFRSPLDIPIQLAANFGEIRPNHWHMGLDIRTEQHENLPVHAAADGYIAEVRIEPAGFGQAVFINHPNGLTTVYGHLNSFAPALQEYVIKQQYQLESWQTDLMLPPELFPVIKGQLVAYSGNTGGSQGPHVHFEIRDTKTTRCLNPLLFGFPLQDNVAPDIARLAFYNRGMSVYEQAPKLFPVKKTAEGYIVPKTTVIKTGIQKLSLAIQARDRNNATKNPNGIYGALLFFDEQPLINFFIDSIDYVETHAINAQVDYKYQYNGGIAVQHLSQLPGDHSRVYNHIRGDGLLDLRDGLVHAVRIEVKDAYLNSSTLRFNVQYDQTLEKALPVHTEHPRFNPNFVSSWRENDFELDMPANVIYDTIQPVFVRDVSPSPGAVSPAFKIADASIPAGEYFTVRIKPTMLLSEATKDRIIIRNIYGARTTVKKAEWQNEWITAKFDDFGFYQAFEDNQPPAFNFFNQADTADLSAAPRLVFWPTDNFGIRSFRAELDGKWLRFTNDKGRAYIYNFDERCPYGSHQLKITVTDLAGNTTVKSGWFRRHEYIAVKKKAGKKKSGTRSKKARSGKKQK